MNATFSDEWGSFTVANAEMIVYNGDINGYTVFFADSKEEYPDTRLIEATYEK